MNEDREKLIIQKSIDKLCEKFRCSDLQGVAVKMARKLREANGNSEGPVSLRPIIDKLNIDYKFSKYDAIDINSTALLRVKEGKFQILVNSARSSNWRRARFSIAHELGHYMFIAYSGIELTYKMQTFEEYSRLLETACDTFAQELLVPREEVKRDIELIHINGFSHIASKYAVSSQMALRSITDAVESTSLVSLESEFDRTARKIKYKVKQCYPGYKRGSGSQVWLPSGLGSDRFFSASKEIAIADFTIQSIQITLGKVKHDVFLTQIVRSPDLDMNYVKYRNALITSKPTTPKWIKEDDIFFSCSL